VAPTPKQLDAMIHPAERDCSDGKDNGQTRVITVRMPVALHTALKREAHQHETSLNRLALAKLRIAGEPFNEAVKSARVIQHA